MALTWGPAGFFFYVDGRLVGSSRFPARIIPLSPYFYVGALGPFFVSRIAVSAEQLPKERLHFDSSRPFPAEAGDALLANDLAEPQFSAAPEFRKSGFVSFVPFDLTAARILYENERPVLRFIGNNFSEKAVTLPVRMELTSADNAPRTVTRSVTLPANSVQKTVTVPLSPLPPGLYQVSVQAGKLDPRSFNQGSPEQPGNWRTIWGRRGQRSRRSSAVSVSAGCVPGGVPISSGIWWSLQTADLISVPPMPSWTVRAQTA